MDAVVVVVDDDDDDDNTPKLIKIVIKLVSTIQNKAHIQAKFGKNSLTQNQETARQSSFPK